MKLNLGSCSCWVWDFHAILCSHGLVVLWMLNMVVNILRLCATRCSIRHGKSHNSTTCKLYQIYEWCNNYSCIFMLYHQLMNLYWKLWVLFLQILYINKTCQCFCLYSSLNWNMWFINLYNYTHWHLYISVYQSCHVETSCMFFSN